jgi:hypothetical protein
MEESMYPRRARQRNRWQALLLEFRGLLHLDLRVISLTLRQAGPEALRVLCTPALALIWVIDRLLPAHLR